MKVVKLEQYGGPEVLELTEVQKPEPNEDEVIIEVKAIGVNYADTARREGQYVVPTPLPFTPGAEIAGAVSAIGDGVTRFKPGDRIVALIEAGGYSEFVAVPEQALIPVPDSVPFEQAVALPLQGLSAYHILKTMGRLEAGETVLVHAAAGGVGTLAVQLAKIFGAGTVIATASTEEKLELARSLGADHLVNYTKDNWAEQVKELTGGKGVDVALEMVGGDIFHQTLKCLAPFGRLVIFGAASGEQAKFYPGQLMRKNQSVIGFFLPQIMRKPKLFQQSLQELLEWTGSGKLQLTIGGTFPLAEAAEAHRQLQGRKTTGKIILKP
ncbi:quinone oxidoreductase family protein [Indiicoccus explosivorum]|uniref:quinone oxidoreductase family protein n=1 Tax=Indiicoccus explosivorum TaxID=1917864 RepID=UPI000B4436C1|nr:quinone oxidoreductase [Indiicoccus explosivorum]